jgi:hypothetical protein
MADGRQAREDPRGGSLSVIWKNSQMGGSRFATTDPETLPDGRWSRQPVNGWQQGQSTTGAKQNIEVSILHQF